MEVEMKLLSDNEVIQHILREKKRYAPWVGAGFCVEAGVNSAGQICEDIRQNLIVAQKMEHLDSHDLEKWSNENLDWNDPSKRYISCIQKAYPNEATRNEFFHRILLDAQPSLSHYSLALLMSNGYLKPTCLTTNFDHLIENAFTQQDIGGMQTIRTETECEYWQDSDNRYYTVKLHGDTDTQNVMNTRRETLQLTDNMAKLVQKTSYNSGLVVLGTTGNEKSIRKLFEDLGNLSKKERGVWSFGLFWGVYMGDQKPNMLESELNKQLENMISQRIIDTQVNPDIVDFINDSPNELFCFFPVWGAGNFMFDLIKATNNKEVISKASRYLDHEMRLKHIYSNAGLNDDAIKKHLRNLGQQREKIENARLNRHQEPDIILRAQNADASIEVRVLYGDITSRALMSSQEFQEKRRAIVSPEDTCISAGGGVAYGLLLKAGQQVLLNELAKFSPISQNEVAVTSAGNLPLHYIIHAAPLKIKEDASYSVSEHNVKITIDAVLNKLGPLGIEAIWMPLIASGAASLKAIDSFEAILKSISEYANHDINLERPITIIIVIYQEKDLPRSFVHASFTNLLSQEFSNIPLNPDTKD